MDSGKIVKIKLSPTRELNLEGWRGSEITQMLMFCLRPVPESLRKVFQMQLSTVFSAKNRSVAVFSTYFDEPSHFRSSKRILTVPMFIKYRCLGSCSGTICFCLCMLSGIHVFVIAIGAKRHAWCLLLLY